jgi:dihydrolipoamide dehydrogenase
MSAEFDLIVIGAGPGGYVCAFRAAQLGLKVALIDKRATLGGTCLNVGCIPSKALLHSSEHFAFAKGHAAVHGIKLGSVWSRLGSDVTIVEFLPKIVAAYDDDIVRNFTRLLTKQGLKIETGAKVTGFARGVLTAERDGKKLEFPADKVLVAVGRRPFTDSLGLEKAGVQLDEKKRVKVDARLQTTVPGIWAIGDVVAGPMLAHKAEEDGAAVAEWIAGKAGHVNWDLVPAIVYTDPEVASVGLGEDAAKAANRAINVGKFNFAANGRAIAADTTDGYVKIIADAKTDKILGAQILGHGAGELISEVVTHMEYGGSAEDLGRTIHAHPTMSEAIKEAGLAVNKSAIHAL